MNSVNRWAIALLGSRVAPPTKIILGKVHIFITTACVCVCE